MKHVLVLLAVLTAVLAAACSGPPAGDDPPPPPPAEPSPPRIPTDAPPTSLDRPTPAPDPLTAAPPPGAVAVPAGRVDASAMPEGFPVLVWTRGERTLGLYGRAGGCTEARADVVAQDAGTVVVRVVQATTSPPPCTREILYPPLEVALAENLGERRVVLRGEVR